MCMIEFLSQLLSLIVLIVIGLFLCLLLKQNVNLFPSRRKRSNIMDTKVQNLSANFRNDVENSKDVKSRINRFFNTDNGSKTMTLPQGRIDVYTSTGVKTYDLCLNKKFCFRLGASPECELVIDNPYISKVHAEIFMDENGKLAIEDLSTNGTYFGPNEEPIEAVYLENGMELSLAKVVKIVFYSGFESPSYMKSNKEEKDNESDVNKHETHEMQKTIKVPPIPKNNELN